MLAHFADGRMSMGKGSREERKPKKVVIKANAAAAPSSKGLPAGPIKPSAPAKSTKKK
jgi:hypothetical protein